MKDKDRRKLIIVFTLLVACVFALSLAQRCNAECGGSLQNIKTIHAFANTCDSTIDVKDFINAVPEKIVFIERYNTIAVDGALCVYDLKKEGTSYSVHVCYIKSEDDVWLVKYCYDTDSKRNIFQCKKKIPKNSSVYSLF
jgi:hypothetical protein